MKSISNMNIPINNFPESFTTTHGFSILSYGFLLSIGKFFDSNFTAIFKDKSVKIYNEPYLTILDTKPTILSGKQNTPQQTLCSINITQTSPNLHQADASIGNPTIADRVAFFHGNMFSTNLV